MSPMAVSLESPIEEKIAWAVYNYKRFGRQILNDTLIADLLAKLKEAIQASHNEMREAEIIKVCSECDREEGGSCCGAGLENKYNGWLLLINLLLDIKLPEKKRDSTGCFFLGETGCLLKARHVICVNYLCKKISDRIDPKKIIDLREREGVELNTLFLLHEGIKKKIRAWNNG